MAKCQTKKLSKKVENIKNNNLEFFLVTNYDHVQNFGFIKIQGFNIRACKAETRMTPRYAESDLTAPSVAS